MRKRVFCFVMLFCLLFSALPVFAGESRVFDNADLLTTKEEAQLQDLCEKVRQDWELDLAYLTTNGTEGMSVREYGAEIYLREELGVGENADGLIFVIDMESREAQIVTCGKAIDIFTDYYIEEIFDAIFGYLSDGDYYGCMVALQQQIDFYCGEYENYQADPNGYVSPYQQASDSFLSQGIISSKSGRMLLFFGGAAIFALIVAGIGVASMRKNCMTIRPFTDGRAYLKENGLHYDIDQDIFANTHTTMMPIPKDNNHHHHGSWGGRSSTFSHGGRSFGGGGRRF